jgi:hypothetical protein
MLLSRVRCTLSCCRFEVVEAAAGAPKLFAASIPVGKTGPQVGAAPTITTIVHSLYLHIRAVPGCFLGHAVLPLECM